jgi:hypothetical protein
VKLRSRAAYHRTLSRLDNELRELEDRHQHLLGNALLDVVRARTATREQLRFLFDTRADVQDVYLEGLRAWAHAIRWLHYSPEGDGPNPIRLGAGIVTRRPDDPANDAARRQLEAWASLPITDDFFRRNVRQVAICILLALEAHEPALRRSTAQPLPPAPKYLPAYFAPTTPLGWEYAPDCDETTADAD